MNEKDKMMAQARGVQAAYGVINSLSRATHYSSYHSYRRSLRWANFYLIFTFLVGFVSLLPIPPKTANTISSIFLILLLIYFFIYYWIISKSRRLKRDAALVKLEVAYNGIISDGWNIYDGIYDEGGVLSLELAFTRERTFLVNLWFTLRKKKQTIPLNEDDLFNLKYYLYGLMNISANGTTYVAYATLSPELVDELATAGIMVNEITWYYKSKPGRWDYATATGKIRNAIFSYPQFHPYLLSINRASFEKELEEQKES